MPSPDNPLPNEPFEACFRAMPARASRKLGDRVMEDIRAEAGDSKEDSLNEWIEHSLTRWPTSPSPEFTESTLSRIRNRRKAANLVPWRLITPLAAGLAACIALVWGLSNGRPETMPAPPIAAIDPTTAEILALAESLEQPARWLLDDAHFTTLVAAAE